MPLALAMESDSAVLFLALVSASIKIIILYPSYSLGKITVYFIQSTEKQIDLNSYSLVSRMLSKEQHLLR